MWLLEANMDVHLYSLLRELGIRAESAAFRGWKALGQFEILPAQRWIEGSKLRKLSFMRDSYERRSSASARCLRDA